MSRSAYRAGKFAIGGSRHSTSSRASSAPRRPPRSRPENRASVSISSSVEATHAMVHSDAVPTSDSTDCVRSTSSARFGCWTMTVVTSAAGSAWRARTRSLMISSKRRFPAWAFSSPAYIAIWARCISRAISRSRPSIRPSTTVGIIIAYCSSRSASPFWAKSAISAVHVSVACRFSRRSRSACSASSTGARSRRCSDPSWKNALGRGNIIGASGEPGLTRPSL